ncbi:MAG: Rha family transcriptional regulator [Gammaproteobacteria bacterium]|nr:Rha family transcriptional regulator [Gammaproteobacteria bacterium]
MTDSELIDKLGGTAELSRLCKVKPSSVSEWRKTGIPPARRMFLEVVRPDIFGEAPKKGRAA